MKNYRCSDCDKIISLDTPKCRCANAIPKLRSSVSTVPRHAELYSSIARDDLESPFQSVAAKQLKANLDFKRLRKTLKQGKRLRILEIGPGDGCLVERLSEHHDVYVMDITDEYLTKLAGIRGAFVVDIENMPFDQEFDLIILCDVLEHVLNEGDAILSIRKALRDHGTVYIRCPANEPLISYAQQLGSPYPYVHLRTYSTTQLRRLALHAGFSVMRCKYVRAEPIGFARRSFGLRVLQETRARRHTSDVARAFRGSSGIQPVNRVDWILTKIEAVTWHVGWRISRRITNRFLQILWYKPSEVFLLAEKQNFDPHN